jgi:lipoate-protein ligase B
MQSPICEVLHLGEAPYEPVWRLQEELALEIAHGDRHPTLLLLEHPHTYTFGRSGSKENLIWNEEELSQRGIHVHWVDRGGDITYHGPGQLVGYPLLPLDTAGLRVNPTSNSGRLPQVDYVGYLRKLEMAIIQTLAVLGVKAQSIAGLTGVWVSAEDNRNPSVSTAVNDQSIAKIAAIGVKVDVKGVTRHGFALNVDPEMGYYDGIIPCGLNGYEVTSISKLIQPVPVMHIVIKTFVRSFGQIFGYSMLPVENPISI